MARRNAFLIGNQNFAPDSGLENLKGPLNDVKALQEVLQDPDRGAFKVRTFPDERRDVVMRALDQALGAAGRDDMLLIFYAGHGKLDRRGRVCLAMANTEVDTLYATSIPASDLRNLIGNSDCGQVVLLLDCCFSGAVGHEFVRSGVDDQLALMSQAQGLFVVSATTSYETASELQTEEAGVVMGKFTHAIVEGITTGAAAYGDVRHVTLSNLRRYVEETIRGQTPQYWMREARGDPVIAYVRHEAGIVRAGPETPAAPTVQKEELMQPGIVTPTTTTGSNLNLKETLEKEKQDKEASAKYAQDTLPILLGTVQRLFRTLEGYLVDVVNSGLATTSFRKTRLKPAYWDTVFFPVLKISMSGKVVVELTPYGPVAGSACRVDMSYGSRTYLLLCNGQGNGAEHWTILSNARPRESQKLTKESFHEALRHIRDGTDVPAAEENKRLEAPQPTDLPAEVNISYTKRRITSERHDYLLQVTLTNRGTEPLGAYHIDSVMPALVVPNPEEQQSYVRERSKIALFRVSSQSGEQQIYPGDTKLVISIPYYVDSNIYENHHLWSNHCNREDVFKQPVKATLYHYGFQPLTFERCFEDFQIF